VRGKTIILVAMLVFLIYGSSMVYAYHYKKAYGYYDNRYDPLIGGVQIEITGAIFGGPPDLYPYNNCSLSFPVKIRGYSSPLDRGFITAGHCANINEYIDQPKKLSWFDWSNFIGRVKRNSVPQEGGTTDLDAGLIYLAHCPGNYPCTPTRDFKPFIFENNSTPYYGIEKRDYNWQVGITAYITPTKNMENNVRVYKSGRTTGVTYGLIKKIDDWFWYYNWNNKLVIVQPAIKVARCYIDPNDGKYKCYYNSNIALDHDSGAPVYIRHLIYAERVGNVYIYHYGAQMVGILIGGTDPGYDHPTTYFWATWATKVKERWPDLELVTCGPDIGKCL